MQDLMDRILHLEYSGIREQATTTMQFLRIRRPGL